jgi:polysaccharide pyruvyl transferase WcaK-like protein
MIIDIRGGNTGNKGAELMLRATVDRLAPIAALTAPPVKMDFDARCEMRLRNTLPIHRSPVVSSYLSNLVPAQVRGRFSLVSDGEIGGVVNIAGFAYGDTFDAGNADREAKRAERWRKRGTPMVMLPQAFGPFTLAPQREACRRLLSQAALVYVRDEQSKRYVDNLVPEARAVLAPDFTIGLTAKAPEEVLPDAFVAIVPNMKLIEKNVSTRGAYVDQLAAAGRAARSHGLEPLVVVHEGGDAPIAAEIARAIGCDVFAHRDPLVLKGAIKRSTALVGSRFHAVVGALSQERPALVLGWSHKYGQLLDDFGVPSWTLGEDEAIEDGLARLLADAAGQAGLGARRDAMVAESERMWARTLEVLRAGRPDRSPAA